MFGDLYVDVGRAMSNYLVRRSRIMHLDPVHCRSGLEDRQYATGGGTADEVSEHLVHWLKMLGLEGGSNTCRAISGMLSFRGSLGALLVGRADGGLKAGRATSARIDAD